MKKFIAIFLIMFFGLNVYAQNCDCQEQILGYENMFCEKGSENSKVIKAHDVIDVK